MKILISTLLRKIALETSLSVDLRALVSDADKKYGRANITRNDPDTFDKIETEMKDIITKRVGHGLSQDKADEIIGLIEKQHNVKGLLAYASNLMLAGIDKGEFKVKEAE
jgi:hypothetical protein